MSFKERFADRIRPLTDPIAERLMSYLSGPYPTDPQSYLKEKLSNEDPPEFHIEYYSEASETFKKSFSRRTTTYSFLSVVVLVICFLLLNQFSNFLQIGGIGLDLLGAGILGRGLLVGPITVVDRSVSGFGGYNAELRDAMLQDSVDGIWGIFLLLSGICLQAIALLY